MTIIYIIVFVAVYVSICIIATNYYAAWIYSINVINETPSVIDVHCLIPFAKHIMGKTPMICVITSPFTMIYILGWKLGFAIYKLKIKGKYEDRFAPWVI